MGFAFEAEDENSCSKLLINPVFPISAAMALNFPAAVDFMTDDEAMVVDLFFLHPPPIGTLRSAPPLVQ